MEEASTFIKPTYISPMNPSILKMAAIIIPEIRMDEIAISGQKAYFEFYQTISSGSRALPIFNFYPSNSFVNIFMAISACSVLLKVTQTNLILPSLAIFAKPFPA